MKVLAISDQVEPQLYQPSIRARFGHVDMVVSCGDLPYSYLDYIVSMLDVPLFAVRGNHDGFEEHGERTSFRRDSNGTTDLHGRVVRHRGLLLAGFEGSRRYNDGPCQYSESEMRLFALRLVPRLLVNKARYGRYLDVLVTHAPPRHIHDQPDRPHHGFETFRWFLRRFRPRYHLHGHIHVYDRLTPTLTVFGETTVVNVFGHRELELVVPEESRAALAVPSP